MSSSGQWNRWKGREMLHGYARQALVFLTSNDRAAGDPAWDPYYLSLVENGLAELVDGVYRITDNGHKELESIDQVTGEEISPAAELSLAERERRSWRAKVLNVMLDIAQKQEVLTVSDVRVAASSAGTPFHPNGWSGIMRLAEAKGWVEKTDRLVKARHKEAHNRKVSVWKSLIWRKP